MVVQSAADFYQNTVSSMQILFKVLIKQAPENHTFADIFYESEIPRV